MYSSPICKLKDIILNDFKKIGEKNEILNSSILSKKLSPALLYDDAFLSVKMPYADLYKRSICLQETYLSYIWAFMYSTIIIFDEGLHRAHVMGRPTRFIDYSLPIMRRAGYLFNWASSLKQSYSKWDELLPSPIHYSNDKEESYGTKVNNLFSKGINFILYHEFAHLTLDHVNYVSTDNTISNDTHIELEKEADSYSLDIIIDNDDLEDNKITCGLAIALVHCSNFFLVNHFMGIVQKKHPDLDSRLDYMLNRLRLESEDHTQYIFFMCANLLRIFLVLQEKANPKEGKTFNTGRDALNYYLDFIATHKII